MPGKDGMSLLREVKEKWPNIPVIVMSGYATTETVEQVSRTEAATFIAKPFTPDELVEAVAKVINSHLHEVSSCYERALLKTPGLAGKIVLEWQITTAGGVGYA